jgi:hypothetical protein
MLNKAWKKYPDKLCRRLVAGFALLVIGFFLAANTSAQCVSFARAIAKPELAPFLHDGNFNATILGEGETIVLKKTVFQGQKYRLVIKGVPELPGLHYRILDTDSKVLFDNASHGYISKWDFDIQTTRTLQVEITVLEDDKPETSIGGCVAVLFGLHLE